MPSSFIRYRKHLQDILIQSKESADIAEEIAINKQKSVDRAIKAAADCKTTAKMCVKLAMILKRKYEN